ncbi:MULTISPECIES: hypothetical protein [Glutamicibacter]|uniref:Hypothetical secreted protein n=3 Tax=Glutamicibacter TaxID=1742989 RepID=A0ABP1U183_GLUAR|nr:MULTISPECIES: hypothetical protein [Glutamicibacter]CBT75131.1 hypothetical secreted protein [Glutamicibacter arilaitensis Re117]HCH47223.1 hypothetical protein [Glutamicibacter sp.]HCJ54828.1 hypothetical protein [Glutamicibacter sp.]
MTLKNAFALTIIVGTSMAFTGCSASDSSSPATPATESMMPLQGHELAALTTVVDQKDQNISLAIPLRGGDYAVALECSGKDTLSTIAWQSDDKKENGEISVPCTFEGVNVREQISLNGYSSSLTFVTSELQGYELTVSIASTAN